MTLLRLSNYAVLPILLMATWMGWSWPWGLLFLWWVVPSVLTGQVFLIDTINRETDTVLYWAVTLLWAVFGALMLIVDLFPAFYATWLV